MITFSVNYGKNSSRNDRKCFARRHVVEKSY